MGRHSHKSVTTQHMYMQMRAISINKYIVKI